MSTIFQYAAQCQVSISIGTITDKVELSLSLFDIYVKNVE